MKLNGRLTIDNIIIPQDDLCTLEWDAEFGGHPFDIYTDPNANNFDENHTQGPDTAIALRSSFHDSSDGRNGKLSRLLTHL